MIRAKTPLTVKRSDIFICKSPLYLEPLFNWGYRDRESHDTSLMEATIPTPSVLLTVIVGVAMVVGVLAAIPRAGQSKRVHFVISDSGRDISVTGSPIEGAFYDRWPIDY